MGDLLRTDLVRKYWPWYLLIAVASLAIHIGWVWREGASPSTDFAVRYDPLARILLARIGLDEVPSEAMNGAYAWSRIGYIGYVAATYAVFGHSLQAVVLPQVAVVWLLYPLIFHLLLHFTGSLRASVTAIVIWSSFLDTYQWHFWALPDALYRLLFVGSAFVAWRLWELQRHQAFAAFVVVAVALLTTLRIETPLYTVPALLVVTLNLTAKTRPVLLVVVATFALVALWFGRNFAAEIFAEFVHLLLQGQVLPGSGKNIEGLTYLVPPVSASSGDWLRYYVTLFGMRAWYAVTPFPALWSQAHRLYYAAYMIPAYLSILAGLYVGVARTTAFRVFGWIVFAGFVLQLLVAVDPSMRYAYTPQVFLFLCAVLASRAVYTHVVSRTMLPS